MPTVSLRDALTAAIWVGALLLLGWFAMHLYNAGKGSQAIKDQPKVTQAVVGEVAAGVSLGLNQGLSQSQTTRLTKAEGTRKVASAAEEALQHVLQQLPPPEPVRTGPIHNPLQGEAPSREATSSLAGDSSLDIPDSVADAYLDGLKRVRESGTSGPQAIHKCPGIPGAWLICS